MSETIAVLLKAAGRALETGAWPEVQRLCELVLQREQREPEAWFFLSVAAAAQSKISVALELVAKALALQPNNPEYLVQQARFHSQLNQHAQALAVADRALALQPKRALLLDTLGVVFSKLGEHGKAAQALRSAVVLAPANAQYQFNLGSVEQFLGHAAAARHCYEQALKLKPDFYRAYWALSELEKNATDSGLLARMQVIQDKPDLRVEEALYLAHAVAREYEKQGDTTRAFQELERSKRRRREQVQYSSAQDEALFMAMQQAFPLQQTTAARTASDKFAESMGAGAGSSTTGKAVGCAVDIAVKSEVCSEAGSAAIFIVGMPRSGTTLVERMLASHSQVLSLGELQEFPLAVKRVAQTRTPVVLDVATIAAARTVNSSVPGQLYLDALKGRLLTERRFIDKMPLNFLYLGFILDALPGAKVVCLRRHPLDTILSNYRQLFALNFSLYNYHYDLADTARYYVLFHQLLQHWRTRYGDRIHEVHYEQLAAAPEPTLRALLDYLGLPWEATCLDFHDNPTAVSTASSMQVRQPLYTSAVGRWRNYGELLQPAQQILTNAGIAWD